MRNRGRFGNLGLGLGMGGGSAGETLGPELVTSFINGSVVPLDTLVTSGVDITSGIALTDVKGCVSNPFFPVAIGEQFKLEITAITINSFTGTGLRIVIVAGDTGNAGVLSDAKFYQLDQMPATHTFTVTGTDTSSFLQLGVAGSTTVDFSAIGISLRKIL